jgi:hypothetical protein
VRIRRAPSSAIDFALLRTTPPVSRRREIIGQ